MRAARRADWRVAAARGLCRQTRRGRTNYANVSLCLYHRCLLLACPLFLSITCRAAVLRRHKHNALALWHDIIMYVTATGWPEQQRVARRVCHRLPATSLSQRAPCILSPACGQHGGTLCYLLCDPSMQHVYGTRNAITSYLNLASLALASLLSSVPWLAVSVRRNAACAARVRRSARHRATPRLPS